MTQADTTQPSPGEPPAIALTRKTSARPVLIVPRVSIVIPTRNEAKSLVELTRKIRKSMSGQEEYELLYIDDSSSDNTWETIRHLADNDETIRGARLRKPSGIATALFAGIRKARGTIVITMSADLQDDPKDLGAFIEALEKGADVVVGARTTRHGWLGKRLLSHLWSLAAKKVSNVALSDMACSYAAYRGDALRTIPLQGELVRFAPAIAASQGYTVTEIDVEHHPRKYPREKPAIAHLSRGFVDLVGLWFVTRHHRRPLHSLALIGITLTCLGLLLLLTTTTLDLLHPNNLHPTLTPLSTAAIIIGSQLFATALVGELLAFQNHTRFLSEEPPIREEIR